MLYQGLLFLASLGLTSAILQEYIPYLNGSCTSVWSLGKTSCCLADQQCYEAPYNETFGYFCRDTTVNLDFCGPNALIENTLPDYPVVITGTCASNSLLDTYAINYTWSCCPCPAGYVSSQRPPLCPAADPQFQMDQVDACVGCSDAMETLVGNGNSGFSCVIQTSTSSSSSSSTAPATTTSESCPLQKRATSSAAACFNWDPLVQAACNNYAAAQNAAPATLGYFGQVLNIVCAAAKSADPCCADMSKYYNRPGCDGPWAGPFVQYVFNVG
jgi:hypothetical protein